MAAGFLIGHHRGPGGPGVEVVAGGVGEVGRQQARPEALANEAGLPEAAKGGEAIANDGRAVTDHVSGEGHQGGIQTAGRQAGVGVARDGDGAEAEVSQTHVDYRG
jgi:hypothetical protein